MKRKTLWIIALPLIAGVLIVSFLSFRAQNASARGITLKDLLFPVVPTPEPLTEAELQAVKTQQAEQASLPTPTVFPEGMENPPTLASNISMPDSEQVKKNKEVLEIVQELVQKAEKTYLTPGWLHVVADSEAFVSEMETLPDGSPLPMKWRYEIWGSLDENGRITQSVSIQDTGDERTNQTSIFKDGVSKNLTLEMEYPEGSKTLPANLDSQFLENAFMNIEFIELNYSESEFQSEKVAVITQKTLILNPITAGTGKAERSVQGYFDVFYFSLETGLLVHTETYEIRPDGEKVLASVMTSTIEKVSEPPAEILEFLK
ncbi:MAG: hypothetical protein JNK32_09655 [Anaerolineales bacterium]|nr:hypothetical protein [Anaerolineales bacterium]